jgi:hypothetical protein
MRAVIDKTKVTLIKHGTDPFKKMAFKMVTIVYQPNYLRSFIIVTI